MKPAALPCRDCGAADRAADAELCTVCLREVADAMQARCFLQGRTAALKGDDWTECPYSPVGTLDERGHWMQGWRSVQEPADYSDKDFREPRSRSEEDDFRADDYRDRMRNVGAL